jgi:hypothetical protein
MASKILAKLNLPHTLTPVAHYAEFCGKIIYQKGILPSQKTHNKTLEEVTRFYMLNTVSMRDLQKMLGHLNWWMQATGYTSWLRLVKK